MRDETQLSNIKHYDLIIIDISKQIIYWQESAKEDWKVAIELVGNNRSRHGLYFAHLALEKILKAHVCKETHDLAPGIQNLIDSNI